MKIKELDYLLACHAMSYRDLADKAAISRKTILDARNGGEVRVATVGKIARALGVSVDELIER